MNNGKNLIILILSVLVIAQSVVLLYVLRRKEPAASKPVVSRVHKTEPRQPVPKKPPVEKEPAAIESVAAKVPAVSAGKIALVLDDWGYNLKNEDFVTNDRYRVTLSILPFREYSRRIAELAHEHGKDVIVHMPMEPHHKEQYGLEENTLLTTMAAAKVTDLLRAALQEVPYARGVSNHMGSRATEDVRLMRVVLGYLKDRDLFFVDSLVTPKSVGKSVAVSLRERFASRDIFIDNESEPSAIREQMVKLARLAKRNGVAIGIGHDRPGTIAVLKEMIPLLEEQGYEFVNISEVVRVLKR